MAEKNTDKKRLTTSHKIVYLILLIYILVVLTGIASAALCFIYELYDYFTQIIIALFSFAGVCGSCSIGFYTNKAKEENTRSIEARKYDKRLELAKEIAISVKQGELNGYSVALLKALVSDADFDTSVLDSYEVPEISNDTSNNGMG